MRNAVMLIHDGSWPDVYLNLSTFFGNVGIFVYDNREIGQSVPANFKGISTFIYLISSSKMLQKLRETTSLPQTSGLILSGKFQGYLSSISPIAADARAKIFCSDDVSNIMDFSLRLFASGETGRYRTLSGLYSIFNKNQLVPSYYCAQYMDLSPEEWKNIISKIAKAVREFEHSRDLPNIEYVFFSSGLGMKRANDICRKVFKQTQTKWSLLSEQQALLFDEKRILTKLEAAYRADDDLKLALMFLNDISQRLRPSIERAQRVFEICLEAPMIYYVYYKWGLLLQRMKDVRAKTMFLRSTAINPSCYRSQYRLGLMCEKEGNFKEADNHYRQIIQTLSRPKYTHPIEFEYLYKAFYRLGIVRTETGHLSSALNQYKKADWLWNTLAQSDFLQNFLQGLVKNPIASVKNRIRKNVLDTSIINLEARIQGGEDNEEERSLSGAGLLIQNQV